MLNGHWANQISIYRKISKLKLNGIAIFYFYGAFIFTLLALQKFHPITDNGLWFVSVFPS